MRALSIHGKVVMHKAFCLCRHVKSSSTVRKWGYFLNAKRKRIDLKRVELTVVFFLYGDVTLLIFTCSFSWENWYGFLSQPWSPETLKQLLFNKKVFFPYYPSFTNFMKAKSICATLNNLREWENPITEIRASASPLPQYFLLQQFSNNNNNKKIYLSHAAFHLIKVVGGLSSKDFEIEEQTFDTKKHQGHSRIKKLRTGLLYVMKLSKNLETTLKPSSLIAYNLLQGRMYTWLEH